MRLHTLLRSYGSAPDALTIYADELSTSAIRDDFTFVDRPSPASGEYQATGASPWCLSMSKRLFDLTCAIPVLILLSPVMLAVSALIRLTSDGPVIFQQERAGLHHGTFTVYKFRTMFHNTADSGPRITKAGDPRLSPVGGFLRRTKLDEIPQLYNVLRGDMSLVGPRPKLPKFEHLGMRYRPGITGAATLVFANEEQMLKDIAAEELEQFHIDVLSPIKKSLDDEYHERATFWSDLVLIVNTVLKRGTHISLDGQLPRRAAEHERQGIFDTAEPTV